MKQAIALTLGMLLAVALPASIPVGSDSFPLKETKACCPKNLPSTSPIKPPSPGQQDKTKMLTGKWETVQPEITLADAYARGSGKIRIEQASIRFEFHADGAFVKILTSRKYDGIRFEERGRWEIAPEGRLLLHTADADGGTITQSTQIKYLEMDELVLDQPLTMNGSRFSSTEDRDLYFNKQ